MANSNMAKAKEKMLKFFGLDDIEEEEECHGHWDDRRKKCYTLKQKTSKDQSDSSRRPCRRKPKKKMESVPTIVWKKAKAVTGFSKEKERKLGVYGRSYAPASLDMTPPRVIFQTSPYKDELFYDEKLKVQGTYPDGAGYIPGLGDDLEREMDLEFEGEIPVAPGNSPMHPDVVRRVAIVAKFEKNACKLFSSKCMEKDDEEEADDYNNRPYFTYFITFVHIVIMITAVSLYGFTKMTPDAFEEDEWVRKPNMAVESVRKVEYGNIWGGPRQADLIHLGAKYTPCMRKDPNLFAVLDMDRAEERTTGCCIRDDGTGCVQTVRERCSSILSTFMKWNSTHPAKGGYESGAVCGQDPNYCKKPSSKPPFEWNKKDMTQWPICEDTSKPGHVGSVSIDREDRHMSCDLLGRPCCHGIQGECMITSREHCNFLDGYYHDQAFLCSQVNCLEEICGMIPFVYNDRQDQFGRIFSSFLLHAGLIHLLISIIFHLLLMRIVEKLIGWVRMAVIYVGCGAVGSLASATLLPYQVEVGPAGSQFGVLAVIMIDLINNILRKTYKLSDANSDAKREELKEDLKTYKLFLGIDIVVMLLLFFLGLFPFMDNWAHSFGFIFGIFLSFLLLPDCYPTKLKKNSRKPTMIVGAVMSLVILAFLILAFYVFPITDGGSISYFNCIPMTNTFCKNQDVSINRGSTYTSKL